MRVANERHGFEMKKIHLEGMDNQKIEVMTRVVSTSKKSMESVRAYAFHAEKVRESKRKQDRTETSPCFEFSVLLLYCFVYGPMIL